MSLPVRGAWVEIAHAQELSESLSQSLPVRGAWVEMLQMLLFPKIGLLSLPVRGAWVEISLRKALMANYDCRSPCGERGLKYPSRWVE